MRLPDSSSSQGGFHSAPARGRDSLSSVHPSTGHATDPLPDSSAVLAFLRPTFDFNSILSGGNSSDGSRPAASDYATEPSQPSESTERVQQTDADENTVEPLEEEEKDEAVEENDSVTVQPLAVVAAGAQNSENIAIGQDQGDLTENNTIDSEADLSGTLPADPASQAPTKPNQAESRETAKSTDATNASGPDATQGELPTKNHGVGSTGDIDAANPVNDATKTAAGVGNNETQSLNTDSLIADSPDQASLQLAKQNGSETVQAIGPSNAELAAQTQQQIDQDATNLPTLTAVADEGSNRSARNGRGRIGGNANQKNRVSQAESSPQTADKAASKNTEAVAGQTDAIDPTLASETATDAAIPEIVDAAAAPTAVNSPLSEAGIIAGQAVNANASEAGSRPVSAGGPAGELAAIGPSSNDGSGRNGDQLSTRNAENLSRTDIADRARLIHRISKAFTKMGIDGGQIRMKMHPETLGSVLLEMRVRGKNIEATVTADNEAARGLLQQQLSELRQRLESQGMTVQRLEVALRDDTATGGSLLNDPRGEMSGGDRGSDGYGQSNYSSGSGNSRNNRVSATINAAATLPKAGVITLPRGPAAPGTLDLRL